MLFIKICFMVAMVIDFCYYICNTHKYNKYETIFEYAKMILFVVIVANRGFF